jgi:hypothetical protein
MHSLVKRTFLYDKKGTKNRAVIRRIPHEFLAPLNRQSYTYTGLNSQAKPSQAKPSQAKPSQAKPSQANKILFDFAININPFLEYFLLFLL